MRVRYTSHGARTLERVLADIAIASPQGARLVQSRIQEVIGVLTDFPRAGRTTSRQDVRRIVASPYPYLIFYRVLGGDVVIDAVRHAARGDVQN